MQGRECSKGMSKSETGLQSLGQGSQERVWNWEGRAGLGTWSSKNRIKVLWIEGICGRGVWEQVWLMEKCGSEFRCSVTWSVCFGTLEKTVV